MIVLIYLRKFVNRFLFIQIKDQYDVGIEEGFLQKC